MLTKRDIYAELFRKGFSAAKLARKLGLHRSTVSRVISGDRKNRLVLKAIAEVLGRPIESLAPSVSTSKHTNMQHQRAISDLSGILTKNDTKGGL